MLTIKQIDAAKPKDKPYRLLDSNGLYLYVPVIGLIRHCLVAHPA